MDRNRALEIINALAAGADPFTADVIHSSSTLQHPDVVRALFVAAMALQGSSGSPIQVSSKNPSLPPNAGTSWSKAEEHKLVAAFEFGTSEKELTAIHGRTLGAIRSRLVKLGKLEPSPNDHRS